MIKKAIIPTILLILVLALSACSISIPSFSTASTQTAAVQSNLGIGILKLEDMNLSITTDQAEEMLPLWMAVKSLGNDSTTAAEEMSALYRQIQETLTTEQVAAIEDVSITSTETTSLAQQYAKSSTAAGTTTTATTQSTGQANMSADMGGEMQGGDMGANSEMSLIMGSSVQRQRPLRRPRPQNHRRAPPSV